MKAGESSMSFSSHKTRTHVLQSNLHQEALRGQLIEIEFPGVSHGMYIQLCVRVAFEMYRDGGKLNYRRWKTLSA
jgi:hypothetical protein